jgi:hypothetical protein
MRRPVIEGNIFRSVEDSDPGSRIPNPYFLELSDKFVGKKFYNSLKTGPHCFSSAFQK